MTDRPDRQAGEAVDRAAGMSIAKPCRREQIDASAASPEDRAQDGPGNLRRRHSG
jgi:hypothetical protein